MSETLSEKKLGVLDFFKLIYDGHPEYSLIAVKAPIEKTVQAFIEFRERQETKERIDYKTYRMKERKIVSRTIQCDQNIPIRRSKPRYDDDDDGGEEIFWGFPFLQVRDSEWTVILRSLFYVGDELYDVPQEAKAVSQIFRTKVITLSEEDTSGAIGYELFENGELLEEFEEGDWIHFKSKFRETPDIFLELNEDDYYGSENGKANCYTPGRGFNRNQFVDAFFKELGIYLPACYPVCDNEKPALAVDEVSKNTIKRADWVFIKEKLEDDHKEPDPDDAE